MQEVHVHAGTEEVLCPLDLDQMEILLDGMEWVLQKIPAGMCQHNHDLLWFSWIFSIGDGDEVRYNKISIIKLMR